MTWREGFGIAGGILGGLLVGAAIVALMVLSHGTLALVPAIVAGVAAAAGAGGGGYAGYKAKSFGIGLLGGIVSGLGTAVWAAAIGLSMVFRSEKPFVAVANAMGNCLTGMGNFFTFSSSSRDERNDRVQPQRQMPQANVRDASHIQPAHRDPAGMFRPQIEMSASPAAAQQQPRPLPNEARVQPRDFNRSNQNPPEGNLPPGQRRNSR